MTGEEYYNLKRGDRVEVIRSFYNHDKGEILKVEYINSLESKIYCRNIASNDVDEIVLIDVLECLGLYNGETPVNDKVIHLPFTLRDEVWVIIHDEAQKGKILGYKITNDCTSKRSCHYIAYNIQFTINGFVQTEGNIDSRRCFSTKEELLKSL